MDIQLLPPSRTRGRLLPLRNSWTHVEDILRCFLPSKADVDGISKLLIRVEPGVVRRADEFLPGGNGFAHVTLGRFDAGKYLALAPLKRSAAALRLMHRGLRVLARHHDIDPALFDGAVKATAATGFDYTFEFRKLCKWHRSRRLRGEVLLTFREGGTAVTLCLQSRKRGRVFEHCHVTGGYWPSVHFAWFRSTWEDWRFVVRDRTHRETFTIDCEGLPECDGGSR